MKQVDNILNMVMRFLMALAMGALVVGGTYQVVARLMGQTLPLWTSFCVIS